MNFQFDSEWEGSKDARSLAEMQVVRRFFIYGNVPIEAPAELDKSLNEIKQEMKDTEFVKRMSPIAIAYNGEVKDSKKLSNPGGSTDTTELSDSEWATENGKPHSDVGAKTELPKTGDVSNVGLIMAIMSIAMMGIVVTLYKKSRKK